MAESWTKSRAQGGLSAFNKMRGERLRLRPAGGNSLFHLKQYSDVSGFTQDDGRI